MIEESLPRDSTFTKIMRVGTTAEEKRLDDMKVALMGELLMRCFSFSPGKPLTIFIPFFKEFKNTENSTAEEGVRFVTYNDFLQTLRALEDGNLVIRLYDGDHFYVPHRRIHIQSWKEWIFKNAPLLEETHQKMISLGKLRFPSSSTIDFVCNRIVSGTKNI